MKNSLPMKSFVVLAVFVSSTVNTADAGHSRHSYVDGAQSMNGRFVVLPKLIMGEKPKKGPTPFHWEYEWKDTSTGNALRGQLEGLRSGNSNVFDPVGSHIFVAPDGETFAVWTPQVTMRSATKKPTGERDSESFQKFDGFTRRLVIYRKTGEIIKRFDIDDFLSDDDWQWFHYHQCQTYWLVEYPGLHTRNAPRPFYALYQISPDYTVLEFRVGANAEASHKAKQRGVVPPPPRTVRVRLTDGKLFKLLDSDAEITDAGKKPMQPFIGRLADKTFRQRDFEPSLDPLRVEGRFRPNSD